MYILHCTVMANIVLPMNAEVTDIIRWKLLVDSAWVLQHYIRLLRGLFSLLDWPHIFGKFIGYLGIVYIILNLRKFERQRKE